ncbi:protein arginine N-methyltransferase 6-like isoform X2 [Liolophura sinensis]|uniref:protein arginine N-methyltransferase 6-like isoform X2 n=1 Tax=Liolophura sinensis TaxID=3198878 RepID=UPI00315864C6
MWAMLKNYEILHGKLVADVGSGTGILSLFAVQAGAKQVYAIEASKMASQLPAITTENKIEERISVIHGKVEDIVLPECVDVIISEWMGYFLLYESMLNSVIQARDRWLKPGGIMMPSVATLYLAPVSDEDYEDKISFWKDEVTKLYKVSLATMIPLVKKQMSKTVVVKTVSAESIQSHAEIISQFDLKTVTEKDLKMIHKKFSFSCFGHSVLHGLVAWFDVGFPQDIKLTTSPFKDETHWEQCVMYWDQPITVEQDTMIKGSISISPNQNRPRFLDIQLTYKVGDHPQQSKHYYMADDLS